VTLLTQSGVVRFIQLLQARAKIKELEHQQRLLVIQLATANDEIRELHASPMMSTS
jgi:hypothetical protein